MICPMCGNEVQGKCISCVCIMYHQMYVMDGPRTKKPCCDKNHPLTYAELNKKTHYFMFLSYLNAKNKKCNGEILGDMITI